MALKQDESHYPIPCLFELVAIAVNLALQTIQDLMTK